jgi:hypothetical protein
MKYRIALLAILMCNLVKAQTTFNFGWANGFGASGNEESYYSKVDGSGNVYITGRITGTVDMDPGVGTNILNPGAYYQCFLAKYSPTGSLIWADVLGTVGLGSSQGIIIGLDPSNNVYVTGFFNGVVDMDPGPAVLSTSAIGSSDLFMSKFDPNGTLIWNNNIGGTSTQINPNDMKISPTGELLITGAFRDIVDFDASLSSYTLAASGTNEDVFVMKYDASGGFQWAIAFGQAASNDFGVGLDIDANDNVYVSGTFQGTVDFDPSVGGTATVSTNGAEDVFMAKYSPTGGYLWAKTIGGLAKEQSYRIKYNSAGELLICGQVQSAIIDADPSPGTYTLSKVGTAINDIFLAKYNASNGALIWAKNTGGNGTLGLASYYMTSDLQNNIYLCGFFDGTTDFDLTNGTFNLTAQTNSGTDIFISKYDNQGNFLYAGNIGGGTGFVNEAYCINIGPNNEVIISGQFEDTQDFDLTPGVFNQTAVGGVDFYIAKYTQCTNPTLPVLAVNPVTVCGTVNPTTLTIASGTLNSAANWVWGSGACGTSTFATGNSVVITPTVSTTYFVRGEGGCVIPGVCTSVSVTVLPLKNISGLVTTGTLTPVAGIVTLYKYEGGFQKYDSLTSETLDALGNFTFTSRNQGNYILRAAPTASNLQTTYAPTAIGWKGAAVLNHGCITNTVQNINVVPLTNLGTGPGVLEGKVLEGLKYGQKGTLVSPGGPVKGIQVKCGRNPGGDAIAQGTTNPNGQFSFTNLPANSPGESYFILVDIPGLDTNGTYHKVVSIGTPTFSNLDFIADSAKITPGLYVGINEIKNKQNEIKFYPNPTAGIVMVDFESDLKLEVYDMSGQLIMSEFITKEKNQIDFSNIKQGIYFIKSFSRNQLVSYNKLVKTNN